MQKRRMWIVATAHFSLTILVVIFSCITAFVWDVPFRILQPHFIILEVLKNNPRAGIFAATELWVCIFAVPVWSYCFGWLWVNLFQQLKKLF